MSLAMQVQTHRKLLSAKKLAPLAFLSLLIAVDAIWGALFHVRFSGFEPVFYIVIVLLAISAIAGQFRNNKRLSEISYHVALWGLFTAVAVPLTYMAASLNLPLCDEELASLDWMLGFDWPAYYGFFAKHDVMSAVLKAAYYSFVPQVLFSVVFFSHVREYGRNDAFFWTASISLVITGLASGLFPAAGTLYHFDTGLDRAVHLHDYFALRNGSVSEFLLGKMEGIVTFPSYHTVVAILLIYIYRGTRLFPLMFSLNALMLLATPIYGGHYLVDMLGGAAVALFSIVAARSVMARLMGNERTDS